MSEGVIIALIGAGTTIAAAVIALWAQRSASSKGMRQREGDNLNLTETSARNKTPKAKASTDETREVSKEQTMCTHIPDVENSRFLEPCEPTIVVVYINKTLKQFSITRRQETSELNLVTEYMTKEQGFAVAFRSDPLEKHAAEELKNCMILGYKGRGYTYVTRNVEDFKCWKKERQR